MGLGGDKKSEEKWWALLNAHFPADRYTPIANVRSPSRVFFKALSLLFLGS